MLHALVPHLRELQLPSGYLSSRGLRTRALVHQQGVQLLVARRAHNTRERRALTLAVDLKGPLADQDGENSAREAGQVGQQEGFAVVGVDVDGGFDGDRGGIYRRAGGKS